MTNLLKKTGGRKFTLTCALQATFVALLVADLIDSSQYATLVPVIAGMYMGANYFVHRDQTSRRERSDVA